MNESELAEDGLYLDEDEPLSSKTHKGPGADHSAQVNVSRLAMWRQLARYAGKYPLLMWSIAILAVITAAMDISFPLVTRALVDAIAESPEEVNLLNYALMYGGATCGIVLCIGGFIRLGGRLQTHLTHDIRRDAFANLQRLSFSYYDHRPVGWLMARMTADCERLSDILVWGWLDLVWGITLMMAIIVTMLILNASVAAVVLSVLPILVIVSLLFQSRLLASARITRALNSRVTAGYNEAITGVLTSKAFVREDCNQQEFENLTSRLEQSSVRNITYGAIYLPVVITLGSLAVGLAMVFGGFSTIGGAISIGTLIAILAIARQMFEPVEEISGRFAELQMAQASAERVLSLINEVPDIVEDSGQVVDMSDSKIEHIELENVHFAYGSGQAVIDHINLSVNRGETIAIVGHTGCGKSTLVNLICRFYEPTSGKVLINGVDYRQLGLDWLQSSLGMILQQPHVFSGTVRENIRYGRLDASDVDVEEAARIADAHDFIIDLPCGYETQTGEGGTRLSSGQKQLLSLARAVLSDPEILVMDEATSSIDTQTEQRIQRGMNAVFQGRIAFVIAHRLATIRDANRILVLHEGRILEDGSHAQLMAADGRYRSMVEMQSLAQSTQGLQATIAR
ncbi:MAG: ABC transporter ATP-binding protein [Granulosicoccus sp.]